MAGILVDELGAPLFPSEQELTRPALPSEEKIDYTPPIFTEPDQGPIAELDNLKAPVYAPGMEAASKYLAGKVDSELAPLPIKAPEPSEPYLLNKLLPYLRDEEPTIDVELPQPNKYPMGDIREYGQLANDYPAVAQEIMNGRNYMTPYRMRQNIETHIMNEMNNGASQADMNARYGITPESIAKAWAYKHDQMITSYMRARGVSRDHAIADIDRAEKLNIPLFLHNAMKEAGTLPDMKGYQDFLKEQAMKEYGGELPDYTYTPGEDRMMRIVGQMADGLVLSGAQGALQGLQWLSHSEQIRDLVDQISAKRVTFRKTYMGNKEDDFFDKAAHMAGEIGSWLIPGQIIGKAYMAGEAIGMTTGAMSDAAVSASARIANILGASTMAVQNGLYNGGAVYHAVYDQTGDESRAGWAATKTFWMTAPIAAAWDKMMFFTGDHYIAQSIARSAAFKNLSNRVINLIGHTASATGAMISGTGMGMIQGGIMNSQIDPNYDWNIHNLFMDNGLSFGAGAVFNKFFFSPAFDKEVKYIKVKDGSVNVFNKVRENVLAKPTEYKLDNNIDPKGNKISREDAAKLWGSLYSARSIVASYAEDISPEEWLGRVWGGVLPAMDTPTEMGRIVINSYMLNSGGDTANVNERDANTMLDYAPTDTFAEVHGWEVPRGEHREALNDLIKEDSNKITDPKNEEIISYNDSIDKQPEMVKRGLEDLANRFGINLRNPTTGASLTGHDIYQNLAYILGGAKEASEALLDKGIVGLKYNSSEVATTPEESRSPNMVVWDSTKMPDIESFHQLLAGQRALTADHYSLAIAKTMRDNKVDPKTIKETTGWHMDETDGEWKINIPIDPSKVDMDKIKNTPDGKRILLKNVYKDPELYAAYPWAMNIWISNDVGSDYFGQWNVGAFEIALNKNDTPQEILNTLFHETQHAIQHFEGFAHGSDPSDFKARPKTSNEAVRAIEYQQWLNSAPDPISNNLEAEKDRATQRGDAEAAAEFERQFQEREDVKRKENEIYEDRKKKLIRGELDPGMLTADEQYLATAGEVSARHAAASMYASREEQLLNIPPTRDEQVPIGVDPIVLKLPESKRRSYFRQDERGAVYFSQEDGRAFIQMYEKADASTFLHETGHIFLRDFENFMSSGKAGDRAKSDWAILLDWLGNDGTTPLTTEQHEQFARGFEAYLMEGRAPAERLMPIFDQFRRWLLAVYDGTKDLSVDMNADVRGVYDRLFAFENETADMSNIALRTTANMQNDKDAKSSQGEVPPPEAPPDAGFMDIDTLADRVAEGDNLARIDPDWSDVDMPKPGEDPKAWYKQRREKVAASKIKFNNLVRVLSKVKELGGIRYKELEGLIGKDQANKLRTELNKFNRGTFTKTAGTIEDVATNIGTDVASLVKKLRDIPVVSKEQLPSLPVNQESLPWIIDKFGIDNAIDYINNRRDALLNARSKNRQEFELNKNRSPNAGESFRKKIWEAHNELGFIDEALTKLADQKAKFADDGIPVPKKSAVEQSAIDGQVKMQAIKWVRSVLPDPVPDGRHQIPLSELVNEHEAFIKARDETNFDSQRAYRSGDRGLHLEAAIKRKALMDEMTHRSENRVEDMKERLKVRGDISADNRLNELLAKNQRERVRGAIDDINTATRGEVSWEFKKKIGELISPFEFKSGDDQQISAVRGEERRTVSDLRQELLDYIAVNPDATSMMYKDDVARLNLTTLDHMTEDDIFNLRDEVMKLRKEGMNDLRNKKAEAAQKLDEQREALAQAVGGRKDDRGQFRGIDKKEKSSMWRTIMSNTQIPSRFTDFIDGFKDFKGLWFKTFWERPNDKYNEMLIHKNQRYRDMDKKLEEFNVTKKQLGSKFYSMVDSDKQQQVDLTLEQALGIWGHWQNERGKDHLIYGNHITEDIYNEINDRLSDNHKKVVRAIQADYAANMVRYDLANVAYNNRGIIPENNYLRIYTQNDNDMSVDRGIEAAADNTMYRNGLKRIYVDRSSSITRKNIPKEYQTPMSLNILADWYRAVAEQEHFMAMGETVKNLHAILAEKDEPGAPGIRRTLSARFGGDAVFKELQRQVNMLANPDFYKGFQAVNNIPRMMSNNASSAFFVMNLLSPIKVPIALPLYLRYCDATDILWSIAKFMGSTAKMPLTFGTNEFIKNVKDLDPQVKSHMFEPFMEELKAAERRGVTGKMQNLKMSVLRNGAKLMEISDMMTRCIGWDAVYNYEVRNMSKDSSLTPEEIHETAVKRAQLATTNTQPSAIPKDLPAFMASDGFIKFFTMFQNQNTKIFGAMTHDLYGDAKTGRIRKAFGTIFALSLGAWFMGSLDKGHPITTVDDYVDAYWREGLASIPIFGSAMVAGADGFGGGSMIDTAVKGIGGIPHDIEKGDYEKAAFGLYTAYSLLHSGMPVTAVKRAMKFAKNGDPMELTGLLKNTGKHSASSKVDYYHPW